jgi:hypothetical protein
LHSRSERGELHFLYRIGATRFTIGAVAGMKIAADFAQFDDQHGEFWNA